MSSDPSLFELAIVVDKDWDRGVVEQLCAFIARRRHYRVVSHSTGPHPDSPALFDRICIEYEGPSELDDATVGRHLEHIFGEGVHRETDECPPLCSHVHSPPSA